MSIVIQYPLARNQYINNSPEIVSCIRAGANTGATCIRPEIISLKNLAKMQKMTPQKYFSVFARVRIQAPHVFTKKLIPQEFFPACIGFVPGGNSRPEHDMYSKVGHEAAFPLNPQHGHKSPSSIPKNYVYMKQGATAHKTPK